MAGRRIDHREQEESEYQHCNGQISQEQRASRLLLGIRMMYVPNY